MPNEKLNFLSFPVFKTISPPQISHNRNQIQEQQILTRKKEKAKIMYNAPDGITKKSCLHVVDLLFQ